MGVSKLIFEYDERIIALRKSGLTCAATAEQLEIEPWTVHNCIRRHGLSGKYRGRKEYDKYIAMRPKKSYKSRSTAFSIIVQGDYDFINIRLLPTSKAQAQRLIKFLQKEGGEVIFENDAGLENA